MAIIEKSGTIYGSYSGYSSSNYQYFRVWANWTTTTNTLDNTTTVSLELYGKKYADNGYSILTTTGTWYGSIYINGVKAKSVSYYKAMSSSSVWLASASATVPHDDDGSKDCAISFSITGPGETSLEGCTSSGSGTIALSYDRGLVRLYTDSTFKNALSYIYTDGEWRLAIPYLYDDGSWHVCS